VKAEYIAQLAPEIQVRFHQIPDLVDGILESALVLCGRRHQIQRLFHQQVASLK